MKKEVQKRVDELIGWIGAGLILIAYALTNFGVIGLKSLLYLSFNIIGSAGIVYISLKKKAYPPAGLNIVWMVIAIYGILRLVI